MLKIGALLFVMISTACADDSAVAALGQSLTPLIQQHFPDAEIKRTETSYTAKHGTMEFTVHGSSKTGEISAQAGKEEGPNYKGFILEISLCEGPYAGAAVVPQHLKRPYWTTFIDAPAVSGQSKHLWIRFSYGGRLSSVFQKAIFATLPKSMPCRLTEEG